jgi:hypothetical protein
MHYAYFPYYWCGHDGHRSSCVNQSFYHIVVDLHKQVQSFALMCFVNAILQIAMGVVTRDTWLPPDLESFFFLTNFTRFFKCSSSPGIMKIVSIGKRDILPLTKCVNIFDLANDSLLIFAPSPTTSRV